MFHVPQIISLFFLALVCCCVLFHSKRLHGGDWVNPLSAVVFINIGVFTLTSYAATLVYMDSDYGSGKLFDCVLALSVAHLFSNYFGYVYKNPIRDFFSCLISLFCRPECKDRVSVWIVFYFLAGAALAFIALMISSGVGLLWVSDTRSAYQLYRSGVGHWWLMYQWLIVAALFMTLFSKWFEGAGFIKLSLVVICSMFLLFFTGSKAAVFSALIIGLLYRHYYIKKIDSTFIALFLLISLVVFLLQLSSTDGYGDVSGLAAYFVDYYYFTAEFLRVIDDVEYRYGEGWLSSLWFYVPRAVISDKPFEYGVTLIHQVMFPGMAEIGVTPGLQPWALSYLDFGAFGVVLDGYVIGSFQRAAYLKFINTKKCDSFMVFVSACYFQVFIYATPFLYLVIAFFLAVCGRFKLSLIIRKVD